MAPRPIASLLCIASLAGCTLIDLSQLGDGSGAGHADGGSSTGNGSNGGGPETGGGPAGGSSGVTQGGGPHGGAPPGESYVDCLLADDPAIYFRANSPANVMEETNLGTLGGTGLFSGIGNTHNPFPGIVDDDDQSTLFTGKNGDGGIFVMGAETIIGGFKPFSVEMWLETPETVEDTSLLLYALSGNKVELRIIERPDQSGLETIELRFLTMAGEERYVHDFADLQTPDAQLLHIVGVYRQDETTTFAGDGSSDDMALYLNGVLVSGVTNGDPVPLPQQSSTALLSLGNGFKGLADEIAIYPRALDAADIERHYAFGRDASLGCDGQ